MFEMRGTPRHYDWGSTTAIPALLGAEPDGRPWAEVWYGDMPSAPMSIDFGDEGWVEQSGDSLPYLAKLLAAERPLSLQTHPDAVQAAAGFARENAAGVAADASDRIYRDAMAKPEIMIAVTPFEALCGFRPIGDTVDLLDGIGAHELAAQLSADGLATTFERIMRRPADEHVLAACAAADGHLDARWAADLGAAYPGDPAAVATLLLNYVALEPGEAIYLGAGNVHVYLRGVGLEVMGPSDNVIRCGLTPKHVDVDEMMSVVQFRSLSEPRAPLVGGSYSTPGAPFRVSRSEGIPTLDVDDPDTFDAWFIPPDHMQFSVGGAVYTVSPV